MNLIIKVTAYGVPALLIVLGWILLSIGGTTPAQDLIGYGWDLIIIGVICYGGEVVAAFFGLHL